MTMPRNYEKELSDLLIKFRAAQTQLNLANAEAEAKEKERGTFYEEVKDAHARYSKISRAFDDFVSTEVAAAQKQCLEARSEVQAIQAQIVDMQVEFLLREGL